MKSLVGLGRALAGVCLVLCPCAAPVAGEEPQFLGRPASAYVRQLASDAEGERSAAAWALAQLGSQAPAELLAAAGHRDPVVRYWALEGIGRAHSAAPSVELRAALQARLADDAAAPRIAAATALARAGDTAAALPVLEAGLASPVEGEQIQAVAGLLAIGSAAQPLLPQIRELNQSGGEYAKRISGKILENLKGAASASPSAAPAGKGKKKRGGK